MFDVRAYDLQIPRQFTFMKNPDAVVIAHKTDNSLAPQFTAADSFSIGDWDGVEPELIGGIWCQRIADIDFPKKSPFRQLG